MNPNHKTVLITGASSGIGAALAKEFVARGYKVAMAARRVERLQELANEISASGGGETLVLQCDVTKPGDQAKIVKQIVEKWGRLDVMVANAGFGVAGHFEKLSLADYRKQFETNVFGLMDSAYASLAELKKTKGILVLIGSVTSYISLPGSTAYAMSKAAVKSFADGLRAELAPEGVNVTLICPGFVESEIRRVDNDGKLHETTQDPLPSWLPMKASAAAIDIVNASEKRISERVVTFHGKILVCIQRHAPWFLAFLFRQFGVRGRLEP